MDTITTATLRELMRFESDICISIYMPTVKAGKQTDQNKIRFKNFVYRAADALEELGFRTGERNEMLEPANSYLNDDKNWYYQDLGLACFISSGSFMTFRLPVAFEESMTVGRTYHVTPLLPLFTNDGHYWVLALDLHGSRLFRGSRFSFEQVDADLPVSIEEALKYEDTEPLRQNAARTSDYRQGQIRRSMFAGHGIAYEDGKEKIEQYFNILDEAVHRVVRASEMPMVLVGEEYFLPIYRQRSAYPKLLEKGIRKDPMDMSTDELHDRTWELVRPIFEELERKEFDRYKRIQESALTSDDVAEIAKAAPSNRIETLFIARDAHAWGTYDNERYDAEVHDSMQEGDQDLIEFAAVQTVLHDGNVFVVEADRIPGRYPASAIFRF